MSAALTALLNAVFCLIKKLRPNVLLLLLVAYGSIVGILILLLLFGMPPAEAFDRVSVPFVALVGGTLAVVKDLL